MNKQHLSFPYNANLLYTYKYKNLEGLAYSYNTQGDNGETVIRYGYEIFDRNDILITTGKGIDTLKEMHGILVDYMDKYLGEKMDTRITTNIGNLIFFGKFIFTLFTSKK